MPEYITKSEPVDKKPYIVYSGEKDAEAGSGGGGGGGGTSTGGIVPIGFEPEEGEELYASYNDLLEIFNSGSIPVMIVTGEDTATLAICTDLQILEATYIARFVSFGENAEGNEILFDANTASANMNYVK